MRLYRPVGLYEMKKILDKDGKEFPPRYPNQPIFYPVLNEEYAMYIAEKWNKEDSNSGFAGYVTQFEIDDDYVAKYKIHCVGRDIHQELWVPAEELEEFNKNIVGKIQILNAYYGSRYIGMMPNGITGFKVDDINKQINALEDILRYNYMDFCGTIFVEWEIINLNLLYWYNKSNVNKKTLELIYTCLIRNNKLFINKLLEF